jgi:hypothetical protein
MRTPIKQSVNNFSSLAVLKDLIPAGNIVNSFLFFGGDIEFNLAESKRLIIAHSDKFVVCEFWETALENPKRIADIAQHFFGAFQKEEKIFHLLQENWPKYHDPFVRSALFFILNRCSDTGLISSGKFNDKHFNPLSLSRLKNFAPTNFALKWNKEEDFPQQISRVEGGDVLLFPIGKFGYNFLEQGKPRGFETMVINHKKLSENLKEEKRKWIVLYKYHSGVMELYGNYNIIMVDKYGRKIKDEQNCKELVIANF